MQTIIDHHTKVLGFINDHVMGFADHFGLLCSFINISQRRQVVYIIFAFRRINRISFVCLPPQKIIIQGIGRLLPDTASVSVSVSLQNSFFFSLRILYPFPGKFVPNLYEQTLVQHIDFTLDRNFRILHHIPPDSLSVCQQYQLLRVRFLSVCLVKYA